MDELNKLRKKPKNTLPLTFNDKSGQVGIRCVDGVHVNNNICYSKPDKLNYDLNKICTSSRSIMVGNHHHHPTALNRPRSLGVVERSYRHLGCKEGYLL